MSIIAVPIDSKYDQIGMFDGINRKILTYTTDHHGGHYQDQNSLPTALIFAVKNLLKFHKTKSNSNITQGKSIVQNV